MKLTKRKRVYRDYLNSEHWKVLRAAAIARDGGKCVRCGEETRLQVHHKVYRGNLEDCTSADVETLCRDCHRQEHGIGSSVTSLFEKRCCELERYFGRIQRPPTSAWQAMRSAMRQTDADIFRFGEMMFRYVLHLLAHEQEGHAESWWMDKAKSRKWFLKGHNVRNAIWERQSDWGGNG